MREQEVILKNIDAFNPVHIFECGQCFRWDRNIDGSYTGVFGNCVANVKKEDNNIIIRGNCRPESQGRYFPILPESPGGTRSISSEFHP